MLLSQKVPWPSQKMSTAMFVDHVNTAEGKLAMLSHVVAMRDGNTNQQNRLSIIDRKSGLIFLVDTGYDLSMLPKSWADKSSRPASFKCMQRTTLSSTHSERGFFTWISTFFAWSIGASLRLQVMTRLVQNYSGNTPTLRFHRSLEKSLHHVKLWIVSQPMVCQSLNALADSRQNNSKQCCQILLNKIRM